MSARAYWGFCAAFTAAFAALAAIYPALMGFNLWFNESVQGIVSPPLTAFMLAVTGAGDWRFYVTGAAVLCVGIKTRRRVGIPAAAALLASVLLNNSLKNLFALPRPELYQLIEESGYSFPSGHAMSGTVFYGLCTAAAIGAMSGKPVKWRIAVAAAAALFLFLLGFSRVYLGVHYAADVIGGYLCGGAMVCAFRVVVKKL